MTRRMLIAALALVVFSAAARAAPAAPGPRLTVTPKLVSFGHVQTVKGTGWPVNEFCRTRLSVGLLSDQNAFHVATVAISPSGRWTLRWRPRENRVGAGRWRLRARQRCESGKDGSAVYVRRFVPIRIRP